MIAKFPLNDTGKDNAIEYAKWKGHIENTQHYVVACSRVGDMGYYVEDEVPLIRIAFETQIFPA